MTTQVKTDAWKLFCSAITKFLFFVAAHFWVLDSRIIYLSPKLSSQAYFCIYTQYEHVLKAYLIDNSYVGCQFLKAVLWAGVFFFLPASMMFKHRLYTVISPLN